MALPWNEIRRRAIGFSKEWRGEAREGVECQSFWNGFVNVFAIRGVRFDEAAGVIWVK